MTSVKTVTHWALVRSRLLTWQVLTGSAASLSIVLRLTPRGVDGGGMTVSSRVVLLPSIAEAASMLGSSMMVWSGDQVNWDCPIIKEALKSRQPHQAVLLFRHLCQAWLTNNISVLTQDFLSRHLWILQLFEEFIQTVCFTALSPLPQLIWHQWRQAACEHLSKKMYLIKLMNMQISFTKQLLLSVHFIIHKNKSRVCLRPWAAWHSRGAEQAGRTASPLLQSPSTSWASWLEVRDPEWWQCLSSLTAGPWWSYCPAPSHCPQSASSYVLPWSLLLKIWGEKINYLWKILQLFSLTWFLT